jgi:hypothetical protein
MLSSGLFPGICSLNANTLSVPSCSIFIGRYEGMKCYCSHTSYVQSVPKRWHLNHRCLGITQKKAHNMYLVI